MGGGGSLAGLAGKRSRYRPKHGVLRTTGNANARKPRPSRSTKGPRPGLCYGCLAVSPFLAGLVVYIWTAGRAHLPVY